jgi:XisI protein
MHGQQSFVVRAGWSGQRRVKGIVLHLRIAGGQVWVEENGTDQDIASELVGLGGRPADVGGGFIHPSLLESLALAVA